MWKAFFLKKITHPTVTSKIFDPTDEDTAISPLPCWATSTLVIKSGTEVPAAKNVRPITWKDKFLKMKFLTFSIFFSLSNSKSPLIHILESRADGGNKPLSNAQWAKTRKKSPFWQENALFASEAKINVFFEKKLSAREDPEWRILFKKRWF